MKISKPVQVKRLSEQLEMNFMCSCPTHILRWYVCSMRPIHSHRGHAELAEFLFKGDNNTVSANLMLILSTWSSVDQFRCLQTEKMFSGGRNDCFKVPAMAAME